MSLPSPWALVRRSVYVPWVRLPEGRMVDLPGRGATYVTDTAGPAPDAPTIVLLHALGTTGLLTWFPSIGALSRRFRVVTLDLRWHGRGIRSAEFSLPDCADDVAALLDVLEVERAIAAGFSMGSIVAQRLWRQHPDRVAGLVLCATTDRFRITPGEVLFHQSLELATAGARGLSRARSALPSSRSGPGAAGHDDPSPPDLEDWALEDWALEDWALRELRRTSPWAVAQALAALGRHHSRPWLPRIDAPTAVVVTRRDHVIPPRRQLDVARRIPGATIHDIDAGHAACVLESEVFVPALVEAAATVQARRPDRVR